MIDALRSYVLHPKTISEIGMQKYKQITLQLEMETLDRLRGRAKLEGDRPVASLIREILLREIPVLSDDTEDADK